MLSQISHHFCIRSRCRAVMRQSSPSFTRNSCEKDDNFNHPRSSKKGSGLVVVVSSYITSIILLAAVQCPSPSYRCPSGRWYAINLYGGYFECSPKLIIRRVEAEGWHDIYKRFGYNPIAIKDEVQDSGYHPDLWHLPASSMLALYQ